jgi:hypothetical protein
MRSLFLILLFVLFYTLSSAQVVFVPEIGAGLSGFLFSPQSYPVYTAASVTPEFSLKVGGFVELPLSKHFYFQPGLFLSFKGAETAFSSYTSAGNYDSVKETFKTNYLEVPVNLFYKTRVRGKGRFIFGIGFVPSYMFGGQDQFQERGKYAGRQTNTNETYVMMPGQIFHAFDLGISSSGGYELPIGLFFRLYSNIGLSNIGFGDELYKNRMWGISVGYVFATRKQKSRHVEKAN